jgi:hypothetical protein
MKKFLIEKKKKLLMWFMATRFFHWFCIDILPYLRGMYYTDLRGDRYHAAYGHIKEGDVVLCVDRKKVTSMVIPGIMSHAAYILGKRGDPGVAHEAAEMTHHNWTASDFFDLCKESDRVIIMECVDWTDSYIKQISANVIAMKDAIYDVAFSLGISALYCSELPYQADYLRVADLSLEDLAGLGRPYISPDGWLYGKNMRVKHDSDGVLTGMMGPQVRAFYAIEENRKAA